MRTLADIIPLRTAACRDAVDAIAMIAAGEGGVDPRAGAHVRSCLRCQAEVAAYRRVLATMRGMRQDRLPVPAGALTAALRALHDPGHLPRPDTKSDITALAGDVMAAGAGSSPFSVVSDGPPAWAVRAAYVGGITAATAASAAGVLVWFSRRRPGLLPAI